MSQSRADQLDPTVLAALGHLELVARWVVDGFVTGMHRSPRKGFSVLLYLHRYTRDTMNLVLNRYLRDYQVKLRSRLAHLTQVQATAPTAKAKTEARKEADKLTKTLHECDEWERQTILPLAQARIELDLDDGVKTNYLKLGEALAPITGLAAREDE